MKNVTPEQFEVFKTKATWYPLTLNFPSMAEKIGFYGAEIGDGVSIVQFWNTDFCTASFHIKGVEIVRCGDKYTIASVGEGLAVDPMEPVMETVAASEPIEKSSEDDLMAARFAAIAAADADDTFRINTPVAAIENDEPTSILDEVKKDANRSSIFDEPKPAAAPIITKGREKPASEAPKLVTRKVVKPPVDQPQRPPKPQQQPQQQRRVSQPAPKPKMDFGDW